METKKKGNSKVFQVTASTKFQDKIQDRIQDKIQDKKGNSSPLPNHPKKREKEAEGSSR